MSKKLAKLLTLSAALTLPQAANAGIGDLWNKIFKGSDEKPAENADAAKNADASKAEASKAPEKKEEPTVVEQKPAEQKAEEKTETKSADASTVEAPKADAAPAVVPDNSKPEDVKVDESAVAAEFANGDKLKVSDVKQTLDSLPPQIKDLPFQKIYELLLRHAVDTKIISIEARKAGFDKQDDVKKAQEERRKALILKTYIEREVKKTVTDKDLQDKYQELKKMLPENEQEYSVSHIMVKDEAKAKKIIQDIKSGKQKFEDALEESIDKPTKAKGGELGWLRRLDVPPQMWEKIQKVQNNEIIDTPLNIGQLGFSILLIKDHRKVQPPEFKDIKDDLLKAMTPEFSAKVLKSMKANADVKLYGLDGKQIPEKSEEELRAALEKDAPSPIDASKLDEGMVVAEFKGGKVTLKEIKESVKTLPQPLQNIPMEKIYELLLIRSVNNKILEESALKAGIEKEDDIAKKITFEMESVLQNAYLEAEAGKLISNEDLRAQYDKVIKTLASKNEMEFRLRHILVASLDDAKALHKRLKSGEKFDDLVKESTDEASKEAKGDLGYVRKGMLPKEMGDAIAKAAKGTMLAEPVNLGEKGYSIIRVEDKRPVEPPKFEQVKGELERALKAEKAVKVVEKLRESNPVKRFGLDGKLLPEKAAAPEVKPAA